MHTHQLCSASRQQSAQHLQKTTSTYKRHRTVCPWKMHTTAPAQTLPSRFRHCSAHQDRAVVCTGSHSMAGLSLCCIQQSHTAGTLQCLILARMPSAHWACMRMPQPVTYAIRSVLICHAHPQTHIRCDPLMPKPVFNNAAITTNHAFYT